MAEMSNAIGAVSIKYLDVFNMKELYNYVRDWLIEKGYVTDGDSDKWMEEYYYENISQTSGKEMVIYWRTSKGSDSPFVKYHLHIDFRVLAMKDVETTFKGKKVKAQKGEVEIIINGFMERDPEDSFGKSPFSKSKLLSGAALDFFKKRIYKSNLEEIKKEFIDDIKELQEKIKNFLEMPSSIEFEPFRPRRGL